MELKIKLKVKDVEIELTQDEAVELKDLLGKLCTEKTEYVPYYPQYPYFPYWHQHNWLDEPTYKWRNDPITYTTTDGTRWDWAIPCNTETVTCEISDNVRVGYSYI